MQIEPKIRALILKYLNYYYMKFAKVIAIVLAAAAVMACNSSKVEGSKEVRDLLPSKGQVDSTSYLLGVNFGLVITQNGRAHV